MTIREYYEKMSVDVVEVLPKLKDVVEHFQRMTDMQDDVYSDAELDNMTEEDLDALYESYPQLVRADALLARLVQIINGKSAE